MQRLGKSALLFIAIGLVLYALVYYATEQLMYRTGKSNPFFKIATVERSEFDWVVLGASHAMPLDFADFNAHMERETGRTILNLASPGTGPLYNRFVFEHFLETHHARNVLYVLDSFAFYSPAWNEDRFADAKLLSRTPISWKVAWRMAQYSLYEGVDPRAVLNYVSGFAKINNRERFELDIWDGEKQFDRVHRSSAAAVRSRIEYLYPAPPSAATGARYLAEFTALIDRAERAGARVHVIKLPLPAQFRRRLPDEEQFDRKISELLASRALPFHDFTARFDEPQFYFDTDHLNRAGLLNFLESDLRELLTMPKQ